MRRSRALNDELAGYLLYALEEMFAWHREQERANAGILKTFESGLADLLGYDNRVRRRGDVLKAWEATMITHLLQETHFSTDSIVQYAGCYSLDFIKFVERHMQDPALRKVIADASSRFEGDERPRLGTVERVQRNRPVTHRTQSTPEQTQNRWRERNRAWLSTLARS